MAGAIGLTRADLDEELPVMYGSTGIWTLLVPVKRLESFRRMSPRNGAFPAVLTSMPRASVHPFCLEPTIRPPRCTVAIFPRRIRERWRIR